MSTALLCRQSLWDWVVSYRRQLLCHREHRIIVSSVTVGMGRQSLWGWVVSYCVVSHCGDGSSVIVSSVTVGMGRQLLCRQSLLGWVVNQCVVSHCGVGSSVVASGTGGLCRQLLWRQALGGCDVSCCVVSYCVISYCVIGHRGAESSVIVLSVIVSSVTVGLCRQLLWGWVLSYGVLVSGVNVSVGVVSGAPNEEWLNQGITSSDHPFLRANVHSIMAHKMAKKQSGESPFTHCSVSCNQETLRWAPLHTLLCQL